MQVETPKGSVKWSNSAKGYGPVGRHYGPDIFIQAGDQVEFEIVRGPKAPQAANPISSSELIRACASSNDEMAWAEFIRRFQGVIAARGAKNRPAMGRTVALATGRPDPGYLPETLRETTAVYWPLPAAARGLHLWILEGGGGECRSRSFQVCAGGKTGREPDGSDREAVQIDPKTSVSDQP